MTRLLLPLLVITFFSLSACSPGQGQFPGTAAAPTATSALSETTPPTIETVRSPGRPLFLAHYMSWYQTPGTSGYWGWHWTMDHFDPDQVDEDGRASIASHYYPLTGPYDSADDDLLEYQVMLMKLSGIDGVIVDWYGIEDFWDYGTINAATHRLFEHVQRAGLAFAICYEDVTIKNMVENGHLPAGSEASHAQEVMRVPGRELVRQAGVPAPLRAARALRLRQPALLQDQRRMGNDLLRS